MFTVHKYSHHKTQSRMFHWRQFDKLAFELEGLGTSAHDLAKHPKALWHYLFYPTVKVERKFRISMGGEQGRDVLILTMKQVWADSEFWWEIKNKEIDTAHQLTTELKPLT